MLKFVIVACVCAAVLVEGHGPPAGGPPDGPPDGPPGGPPSGGPPKDAPMQEHSRMTRQAGIPGVDQFANMAKVPIDMMHQGIQNMTSAFVSQGRSRRSADSQMPRMFKAPAGLPNKMAN